MAKQHDVGGVELERPFKVRRLDHLVFYYTDFEKMVRFYEGILGFRMTDSKDNKNARPALCPLLPTPFYFMTIGQDQHNMAFVPNTLRSLFKDHEKTSMNHYAWDLGSYEELRGSLSYLRERGVPVAAIAQRMPGSNYAVYYADPESNLQHTNWTGEVIGWGKNSKPYALWESLSWEKDGNGQLDETVPTDEDQTNEALLTLEGAGKDTAVHSLEPYRDLLDGIKKEFQGNRYNVHGSLLPRPFKMAKLTYVSVRSEDPEALATFYKEQNGFKESARTKDAIYLRYGADHTAFVIHQPDSTTTTNGKDRFVRMGMQLRTYAELKAALTFMKDNGVEIVAKGRAFPGGEYYIDILDPEKHQIRLFFYMEQIGWDGVARSPDKWKPLDYLPDKAEVSEDTYNLEALSAYCF
tara:strand:+ start:1166 stop:2392 length:1227 start_codon:yes stop_codon:yes gene_type:complete